MIRCINDISADFLYDCAIKNTKGLEKRVLIINFNDIDRKNTKISTDKTTIEKLALKEGKRAYLFEGKKNHFTGNQKYNGGFKHEVSLRIYQKNRTAIQQMNRAVKGTFVAIVETLQKGENMADAFEVLGFDAGLQVADFQHDYAKDSVRITFATPSNLKEPNWVYKWLETDYKTTSKLFENRLLDTEDDKKIFDTTFDNTFE